MKAVRIPALAVYTVAFVLGHSAFGQSDDAERLLADGDRLAWLKNWQAAEPFFEKAEVLFRERGEPKKYVVASAPKTKPPTSIKRAFFIKVSPKLLEKVWLTRRPSCL